MLRKQEVQCIQDLIINIPENREDDYATVFLDKKGQPILKLTYYDLKARCLNAAQQLLQKTTQGELVLLSIENQSDFVIGFFACLITGCIPAPLQAFRHANDKESIARIRAIVQKGDVSTMLISESQQTIVDNQFPSSELNSITIESLLEPSELQRELPEIDPQSIAYIQYTSGATNHPKGVCLTHHQVLENLSKMYRTFKRAERARVVGWLPFHHDMGLVGHLFTVLYESGLGVFIHPSSFLSDPNVWLQAIHDYRGTIAAVPAFAIEECVRRVNVDESWDLSCFKHLYVGSETVAYKPLIAFSEKIRSTGFEPSFIYPVYGLAEATLLVAGGDKSLAALMDKFVDKPLGNLTRRLTPYPLDAEHENISIRDRESGERLADGLEGEIIVTAPYIFSGYYHSKSGNLPNEMDALLTGDVGYISDGFLYITGRCKEVIIIRGVNYHAEDLECSAKFDNRFLRSQDKTACVSHITDEQESLIVFQEIQRHTAPEHFKAIVEKMQANLLNGFGIKADSIHLIPAGLLPKTRNHKISRNQCVEKYLNGNLKPLYSMQSGQNNEPEKTSEDDPIVIVGMACRFPGGADDLESFWQMLCEGKDGITRVPPTRWDNSIFFDSQPAVPGKMNTSWSGFTDGIDQFDPALFGISPYEAPELDPQQRMLLETSWRLLEHTGWKKEDVKGSDTGVFVGISNNDYLYLKIKLSENLDGFNAYSGLGNANSVAANRLSYFYDFKGPSLAVDTACSSSLTAFNYAVKAIQSGECQQAIAGGVNAIISPGTTVTLSQFGMMSPKGRCKAFDSSADGYVRSEGCGLVMLKRHRAAIKDGDQILAVVKSSVAGQDGQSSGMTFPNGSAQRKLITKTLQQANLNASQINYIEAHGTGTPTGDPVEVEQLVNVYGDISAGADLCNVGSVKANIGHLESAAGIAGLIKVVLMLNRHRIPPQLHISKLNPRIHLENSRLTIPVENSSWQSEQKTAAISSFGFGGSLAHVILAESDTGKKHQIPNQTTEPFGKLPYRLFIMSHHSAKGLMQQVKSWLSYLDTETEISLNDLTYTQAICRSHLKYRKAFIVKNKSDIKSQLERYVRDFKTANQFSEVQNRLGFLFTGQGSEYAQMGSELYNNIPVFRESFDRCANALKTHNLPMPLSVIAFEPTVKKDEYQCYQQVVLFSIQYALGVFWQECGIVPNVLLGHSLGEYAAACLAGCFEPETGVKILLKRSELVDRLTDKGGMVIISAGKDEVETVLNQQYAQVAVVNSTTKTVIAGSTTEINRVANHFKENGVASHQLSVPAAFHCHLLDPVIDDFRDYVNQFEFRAPDKPWISSTTATLIEHAITAEHWVSHLRNTVQFSTATNLLDEMEVKHFLEVGPGSSTLFSVKECLQQSDIVLLRSFCQPKGIKNEASHLFDTLGALYESGWDICWQNIQFGIKLPQQIPRLVFEHKRYWIKGLEPANITAFAGPVYGLTNASHITEQVEAKPDDSPAHYDMIWVKRQRIPDLDSTEELRKNISWILLGSDSKVLQSLKAQIKARGHQVFWVSIDDKDDEKFDAQIRSTDETSSAFDKLNNLITSQSRANTEAWKIVYLPDDTVIANKDLQINQLKNTLQNSLGTFITCLKALRHLVITPPVWVVTCQSQQVEPHEANSLNLSISPVWGFAKTLFLEHPEWRGGMIDFDTNSGHEKTATRIMTKILNPDTEHCVAFRNDDQYVEQLVLAQSQPVEPIAFRNDGAFIITGGLGGLGLKTAKWVIEKGSKHVILLSRKELPPQDTWHTVKSEHKQFEIIEQLKKFLSEGIKLEIFSQDVRDLNKLEKLFASLEDKNIPVRGIIHAAGVNWFAKIMDVDKEAFFSTLDTKIAATWKLHQLSESMDLDCFILYSSVSALWGSVNLSHYTAANFFLDSVSLYRKGQGLTSLSIDWGPWAQVGMSAKPEEEQLLGKMGFSLMSPGDALGAMEQELLLEKPLSLIGKVNWALYQSFIDFTLQPSLFEQVTETNNPIVSEASNDHLKCILDADTQEARNMIKQVVNMELRSIMLIESMDEIPGDKRFNFMGMDSLMAILFATKLEQYFNVKLSNAMAYNYPHINAVTDHLFERVYLPKHTEAVIINKQSEEKVVELGTKTVVPKGNWLVEYKPVTKNTKIVIYCFPYTGSGPLVYQPWCEHLDVSLALIGVQPPGKDERCGENPHISMRKLIDDFIEHFEPPGIPFIFYGHSLGAQMAYESCVALTEKKLSLPVHLLLSGCNAPAVREIKNVHKLPDEQFVDAVLEKYEEVGENSGRRVVIERTINLLRADIEILETYQPSNIAVDVPLSIIAGLSDTVLSREKVRNWVNFSNSNFEISYIPGGHMMVSEQREDLITKIAQTIKQYVKASVDTNVAEVFVPLDDPLLAKES